MPRVHLKAELSTIQHWLSFYVDDFFSSQTALFVGFVVLCFMSGRDIFLRQMAARWPVWLSRLGRVGMYALVHAELRYVGVFFTLIWVGLFSGVEMPPNRDGRRLVSLVTLAVTIAIASPTILLAAGHLTQDFKRQPNNQWQDAQDLRALGGQTGRQGGAVSRTFRSRLGTATQCDGGGAIPGHQLDGLLVRKTGSAVGSDRDSSPWGVTAIVAEQVPSDQWHAPGPEWHKLGDGRYFALKLAPDASGK